MNAKRYTYSTDADINARLNALGEATCYTVVIAGADRTFPNTYTKKGAQMEVDVFTKVFKTVGIVVHAVTGEIVYTADRTAE